MASGANRYFGSASLIGLAALLCQSPAAAEQQDACGPLVDGAVTCPEAQNYDQGIRYDAPGDIRIIFEGEQQLAPEAGHAGIIAISEFQANGSVTIDGSALSIRAEDAIGAVVETGGDILIDLASVSSSTPTSDKVAGGIWTATTDGDTRIKVGSVETSGYQALGIRTENFGPGSVQIEAGTVSTAGFASDGIVVVTGGDAEIRVGSIRGEGEYIWGVNLVNSVETEDGYFFGNTVIDVGSIDLKGDNNAGIVLTSRGNTSIRINELTLDGSSGTGVQAESYGTTIVEVDKAVFKGSQSGGIFASGIYGGAHVKVGSVIADGGAGIGARSDTGNAFAEAEFVQTNGLAARGIQALSESGNATVRAGEVSTDGLVAHAIFAEAMRGNVAVTADKIATKGEMASGILAIGRTNQIDLGGSLTTDGKSAHGITSSTTGGDNVVQLRGNLTTAGETSHGLLVVGRYGTAKIHASGTISTSGEGSDGIRASGEDGQVLIEAQSVATSGDGADGIHARSLYATFFLGPVMDNPPPFTGNIDIRAAKVDVTGARSVGISAKGLGNATIVAGDVTARAGTAVETDMIGGVSIDLRGAIRSDGGNAIAATGADVSLTVGSSARIFGAQDAVVINAVGVRCVMEDPGDGSPNPCPNPGNDDNDFGIGVAATSAAAPTLGRAIFDGKAQLVNRGVIEAREGFSVRVQAGEISLENHGEMRGAVQFAGGDDLFDNHGIFLFAKDSDFGSGVDVLRNSGTIRLAGGQVAIAGLERLENSGAIDLRNGAAGNVLTLSGDYIGNGGATLHLDIDAAGGKSDRLVIEGSASGSTRVSLAATASDAKLTGPDGVVLIEVAGTSAKDAFVLAEATRDIGLVRYSLVHDDARGDYSLIARAGTGAYRQLGSLQAADDMWASSADIWRGRGLALRDNLLGGDDGAGVRLWGTLQAGRATRDWRTGDGADSMNLDYRQTRNGGQLGFDLLGHDGEDTALRAGITGGYSTAKLRYDGGERIELSSANLGLYANYAGEKLFANLLVKYDRHDIKLDAAAFAARETLGGSTWGADADVGLRLGSPAMFVEPSVGLAWTRTSIDSLANGSQRLDFEDSTLLKARAGARFGGRSSFAGGGALTVYASANAVQLFGDDYALTVTSGLGQRIDAKRLGTYGEGRLGVTYRTAGGFEIFAEGQGELGGGYDALTGRAGFRIGF